MTNTPTMDTAATVRQVMALEAAGCELVRITAQNLREANQLRVIKKELNDRGCSIPLAADIHYLPEAAEVAARFVEKVRINPGNYSEHAPYSREPSVPDYRHELERIAIRLRPLLLICRQYGTVLRIGTNHGSLSGRIVDRYGNTPEGMAESALEFVRICRDEGFHNIVLSMKASNILTVLHSNRLLVKKMKEEGMDYPIHLGVTEAGEGEDGRIRSAAGIGILLAEGIGDTVRVSLTEDPVREIPFARKLVGLFNGADRRKPVLAAPAANPFSFRRMNREAIDRIGGDHPPAVISDDPAAARFDPLPDYLLENGVLASLQTSERIPEDRLAEDGNPDKPLLLRSDLGDLQGEDLLIKASIELGRSLADGIGDALLITGGIGIGGQERVRLAFDILQATGRRISKTDYISCPSCGRTQFDIQETLRQVKERTGHLTGLKIAVMGCIVNGPGEMADADWGYVGAGPGKVHIYRGHTLVKRNIPSAVAVEELLALIGMDLEKR